jgi:hypothetical protein
MNMRSLIAVLTIIAVLVPSVAEAGKFSKKRTTCSSYTYITGTTKTTCRTS